MEENFVAWAKQILIRDSKSPKRAQKSNSLPSTQNKWPSLACSSTPQLFRSNAWLMRYIKPCVYSVKAALKTTVYNRHLDRNRFISTKYKCFYSASYSVEWLKQPTLSRVISSTILLFNRECFSDVLNILGCCWKDKALISKIRPAGHNILIIQLIGSFQPKSFEAYFLLLTTGCRY